MSLTQALGKSDASAEREEALRTYLRELMRSRLRLGAIVVLTVLPLGGLLSYFTGQESWQSFTVRGLVITCAALTLAFLRRTRLLRRVFPLAAALCLAVGFDVEVQILLSGGASSPYFPGMLLLIITTGLLFPFTARQAAGVCVSLVAIYIVPLALYDSVGTWGDFALKALFLACSILVVVMGAHAASARRRREFMANLALAEERERSEKLLCNILPSAIAERLKRDHHSLADGFSEATILFADIVGFTQLSQTISPEELVDMLNEVFSEFDNLAEKHGLEKIKTIGDSYMVVGGVPDERDDHAEAVADMALDIQKAASTFELPGGKPLQVRVGINSGSVVAGVIGRKKFIYDLWGDAVNTASRMESHGQAGRIQVTEATYEKLKDRFDLEPRGTMHIKGKGEMPTYLLLGRKEPG